MSDLLLKKNLDDVFNERDSEKRLAAIRALYAEDAVFYEGDGTFEGIAAMAARFDALIAPAPTAFQFRVVGKPGRIRDLEQLAWELGPAGAAPVASGLDVAVIVDGKIQSLYTFVN